MTYADNLSAAWADHLAPRKPDAPTVVSTFAGCGGSSLGYSMAGYRELLAVEWDDHAAYVFGRNFPEVPFHHGDIANVRADAIDLAPGELDVLDGSPPCQGFSMVGDRDRSDPRNKLFLEFIRLLGVWQPRVFVMENVAGMVIGHMRPVFREILAALRAAGHGYRVEVQLLDASWLGVPQQRRRMVFIGVRADLNVPPLHPRPSNRPMTVRDAWLGLEDPGEVIYPKGRAAVLSPLIQEGQSGRHALMDAGRKGSFFGLIRLGWKRPSPTIVRTFSAGAIGYLHPGEERYVGTRELARLGSFPDEFSWGNSTYAQIHARIGNSVPPLMMRAVATTIRDRILDQTSKEVTGDGTTRPGQEADAPAHPSRR